MHVVAKSTLKSFWESSPEHRRAAKKPLEAWHAEAEKATWRTSADIKRQYRSASVLKNGRVVFNIKGNDYRLVVKVHYESQRVYICWVGTHDDYDKIDAETVRWT
jgi:mRNA interferase HigB